MSMLRVFTLLIVGFIWTCSPHEELEIPSNPLDPDNPIYVSPDVVIISGPTEAEVINTESVTITWQGNESASEYSYMYDSYDWSDWSPEVSTSLGYLDEGSHLFKLKARSINGVTQEIPLELGFSVDAVSGPSAIVYPYLQRANPGDTLVYHIIAEEVTDLFAVEVNISIDDEYLELIDVIDGELIDGWGGEVLRIQEVSDSNVSLSIVAVEGVNDSFSGTTSILSLVVKMTSAINPNMVMDVINPVDIVYLNDDLEAIPIMERRVGNLTNDL